MSPPSYENPTPRQDVNVSRDNPLVEFLRLTAGLALVVAGIGTAVYFGGSRLARLVPLQTELALAGTSLIGIGVEEAESEDATVAYLQELTERLAAKMDLPAAMKLRVHYLDTPVPNAFATLGGHIAVTRGLFETVQTENALAMVLAHEIAHVRARDPIANLGGSATIALALTLVTGDAAKLSSAFAHVIRNGYSRSAERQADEAAIEALRRLYGHAGGGAEVFEAFARYHDERGGKVPSLLSTHPLDAERIERLRRAERGWDATQQPLRPIERPAR